MRVATWNVNGIRARWHDVVAWADAHRPDAFALQEIKASAAQVPEPLTGLPDYFSFWHGAAGGYSGVSLHVRRTPGAPRPSFSVPGFDAETRVAEVALGGVDVLSLYVPNGNKDYAAKLRFLAGLRDHVRGVHAAGRQVVLLGDLNVTRTDADVHETHRKEGTIGQRADERALLQAILDEGLVDVGRARAPDDDSLFTWWPPWREEKQKNRGWRIDYVLVSAPLFEGVSSCVVLKEQGTSDHAPVMVDLVLPAM